MFTQYNANARRRIDATVRAHETLTSHELPKQPPAVNSRQILPTMALADEDIEHGDYGDVKLAGATSFDSNLTATDKDAFPVWNPGPKIWEGSPLLLMRACLAQAERPGAVAWVVARAWSATRIRGTTIGAINHGATGPITVVRRIDGEFSPTTVDVYLPTDFVDVGASMVIWAELVYRSEGSRWEAYSADCDGSP